MEMVGRVQLSDFHFFGHNLVHLGSHGMTPIEIFFVKDFLHQCTTESAKKILFLAK